MSQKTVERTSQDHNTSKPVDVSCFVNRSCGRTGRQCSRNLSLEASDKYYSWSHVLVAGNLRGKRKTSRWFEGMKERCTSRSSQRRREGWVERRWVGSGGGSWL